MPIKKILVANRSEIAIRVFRAANELNIKTVACYAEEDKLALHRFKADEAYLIGKGKGPVEAYLQIDEYIRVARISGADAIHPGYGLLSESPEFADACEDAGIIFIGPRAQTMRDLGNKVAARNMAIASNVPVIPATEALPDDMEEVKRMAAEIGYPLMLKASWGGGGRGMRRIMDEQEPRPRGVRGQARGQGRLRQGRDVSREADRAGPPRRGAADRRQPRQPRPPLRARLLGAAAQPEGGGTRAGAVSEPAGARRPHRRRRCGSATPPTIAAPAPSSSCSMPTPTSSTSSRSTRASRSSTPSPSR